MLDYKPIPVQAVSVALEKAKHYRLLNEPRLAESICRDVLHVDKDNHDALVTMLLALTDQFGKKVGVFLEHAQQVLLRRTNAYERQYYAGIIYERWAKAQLEEGIPGHAVYDRLRTAMSYYDKAAELAQPDNPDTMLRWNTCVRILKRNTQIRPRPEDRNVMETEYSDDAPLV
jgi:hypothetical protein